MAQIRKTVITRPRFIESEIWPFFFEGEDGRPRFNNKDPQGSSSNPKYLKFPGLVLPQKEHWNRSPKRSSLRFVRALDEINPSARTRTFHFCFYSQIHITSKAYQFALELSSFHFSLLDFLSREITG